MKQFDIPSLGIKFRPLEFDAGATPFTDDEIVCLCGTAIRAFIKVDGPDPEYGFISVKLTESADSLGLATDAIEIVTSHGNGWARDITAIAPKGLDDEEDIIFDIINLFTQRMIASADKIRQFTRAEPENSVFIGRINKLLRGLKLPETHRRIALMTIEDDSYDVSIEADTKVNDRIMFADEIGHTVSVYATDEGLYFWTLEDNDRLLLDIGPCTSLSRCPEGILAVVEGNLFLITGKDDDQRIIALPHLHKEITRVIYTEGVITIQMIDGTIMFKAIHQLHVTNMWRKAIDVDKLMEPAKKVDIVGAFRGNTLLGHSFDENGDLRIRLFAPPKALLMPEKNANV